MSIATLRQSIATALENPTVWQVFSYPPASPLANSVVISPDDPYVEPTNNTWPISAEINFKLTMIVPMFDNQGNLGNIEVFINEVFKKLYASSIQFRIGSFSAPAVLPVDAGQMLACDVTITTLLTWE